MYDTLFVFRVGRVSLELLAQFWIQHQTNKTFLAGLFHNREYTLLLDRGHTFKRVLFSKFRNVFAKNHIENYFQPEWSHSKK